MSKSVALAPLADHIVSRTPPLSYPNATTLFINLTRRNSGRLGGSYRAIEILQTMVEQRLRKRDGAAFSEEAGGVFS